MADDKEEEEEEVEVVEEGEEVEDLSGWFISGRRRETIIDGGDYLAHLLTLRCCRDAAGFFRMLPDPYEILFKTASCWMVWSSAGGLESRTRPDSSGIVTILPGS